MEGFRGCPGLVSNLGLLLSGEVLLPKFMCEGLGMPSGFNSEMMAWFCALFSQRLRIAKIDHCVISEEKELRFITVKMHRNHIDMLYLFKFVF